MDRRSFLAVLGAVGVLTGVPRWLLDPVMRNRLAPGIELPDDDDVSAWLEPQDLAVYGRQKTYELFAVYTGGMSSGLAHVRMARLPEDGGHTLHEFVLLPGQIVRWVATPGYEIYGPVRIVTPDLVQAHVIGTDARGRLVAASKDAGIVPLYHHD